MGPTTIDSRVVKEVNETTPKNREDEPTCEYKESLGNTNKTKNDDGCEMTPQIVHINGRRSEGIEESKTGIEFNSLEGFSYYSYGR